MALISLVYVSFETHPMTDTDLKDILQVARATNNTLGITGMLLYRDGFFIQALEGDEAQVVPLFEKIATDARHRNVLMVYKNAIVARNFGDWLMGFNKISDDDVRGLAGFIDIIDKPNAEDFAQFPDRAHHLLEHFKNRTYF